MRDAVLIRRNLGSSQNGSLATDLNTLGLILVRSGEPDSALTTLQEALRLMSTVHEEGHTFIGKIAANLGFALGTEGKWDQASIYLQQAIDYYQGVFATDHPDVLAAKSSLARALQINGDLTGSEALFGQLLVGVRSRFGERHENVGHVLNNFALMVEEAKKNYGQSADLYKEALGIYLERFGGDHPFTAIAMHNRARALWHNNDDVLAEKECRSSLSIRRKVLRENHPDIARSEFLLGRLLMRRGAMAEAESHLFSALSIRQESLTPEHAMTASSKLHLGLCLKELDRKTEALAYLSQAHTQLIAAYGENDSRTIKAMEALSTLRQ